MAERVFGVQGNGVGASGGWRSVEQASRAGVTIKRGEIRNGRVISLLPRGAAIIHHDKAYIDIGFPIKDGLLRRPPASLKEGDSVRVKVIKIREHPQRGFEFDLSLDLMAPTIEPKPQVPPSREPEWRETESALLREGNPRIYLGDRKLATVIEEYANGTLVSLEGIRQLGLIKGKYELPLDMRVVVDVAGIQIKISSRGHRRQDQYRFDLELIRKWDGPKTLLRDQLPPVLAARLPEFVGMQVFRDEKWYVSLDGGDRRVGVSCYVPRHLMGERLELTPTLQVLDTGVGQDFYPRRRVFCDANFIPVATVLLGALKTRQSFAAKTVEYSREDDLPRGQKGATLHSRDYLEANGFRYRPAGFIVGESKYIDDLVDAVFKEKVSFSLGAPGFTTAWDEWDLIQAMAAGHLRAEEVKIQ